MKQSSTWFDVYLVNVKSSGRLFQIFVAFSECPNFKVRGCSRDSYFVYILDANKLNNIVKTQMEKNMNFHSKMILFHCNNLALLNSCSSYTILDGSSSIKMGSASRNSFWQHPCIINLICPLKLFNKTMVLELGWEPYEGCSDGSNFFCYLWFLIKLFQIFISSKWYFVTKIVLTYCEKKLF